MKIYNSVESFVKLQLVFLCRALQILSYEQFEEIENDSDNQLSSATEIGEVNVFIDPETTTEEVDRSNEEWVTDAVLDVAYYLRAHKFNDFDRRYSNDYAGQESIQYQRFPNPPLMFLHWEVYKYCDRGFYDCLAYLQDTVLKAALVRSLDTNTIMNEKHWEYPRNAKSMRPVDIECVRLKSIDWRDADPFKGPLERFQWRVSASYYMCHFTMQDLSPLVMFGERCDNFASCLTEDYESANNDPRADNSKPFQCAIYSFCPEVCCPYKKIDSYNKCLDYEKNPCYWLKDRSKRQCTFLREKNRELAGMALNQWNVTCHCEPGFEWESMFGACVDVDECDAGTHNCVPGLQTCVNLQGHYACVCAWGYINVTGSCLPNDILNKALEDLHKEHHDATTTSPRPFSLFNVLFGWHTGLFHSARERATENTDEFSLLGKRSDSNTTRKEIEFNTE